MQKWFNLWFFDLDQIGKQMENLIFKYRTFKAIKTEVLKTCLSEYKAKIKAINWNCEKDVKIFSCWKIKSENLIRINKI